MLGTPAAAPVDDEAPAAVPAELLGPTPAAACPGLRSTASAGGSTRRPMAPSYHCGKALFSVSNLRSYHLSQGAYARANPFVSQGGGGGTRFTLLLSGGGGSTAAESPPRALGTNEPRGLAASEVSLPAPVWRNFSQRPAGASSGRRLAAKTLAISGRLPTLQPQASKMLAQPRHAAGQQRTRCRQG